MSRNYTIGIVGLGLMGGSLALALRGFRCARLLGADQDDLVCRRAQAAGAVHEATTDTGAVIAQADLLFFCVYAHHIPNILEEYAALLKPGCLVSDICGVKGPLYQTIMPLLPDGVEYVGVHPMAGKERDGYENAEAGLYRGCGFLITPTPRSTPAGIALMKELAGHIGAARMRVVEPAEHDAIIAYTSDLMHIASACLCAHPHAGAQPAFMAGAFRDCTRVADINADAWAELLMDNRRNTIASLDQYLADLSDLRAALAQKDKAFLRELLHTAGENKRELGHS
ncbi:MAG: prephenate dehydrogenase [Oscillospiraceae bacterium]|nr:prephenate dehydrogenase [Oscillospiraceae bacterium]